MNVSAVKTALGECPDRVPSAQWMVLAKILKNIHMTPV